MLAVSRSMSVVLLVLLTLLLWAPAVESFGTSSAVSRAGASHLPHSHQQRRQVLRAAIGGSDELVSVPIHPHAATSRQTKLAAREVEGLRELATALQGAAPQPLPTIVIIPSWRQHVIQFDGMCAALGVLGFDTIVASISDNLWAFTLKRLGIRSVAAASKRRALMVQVMFALNPIFARLEEVLSGAAAAGQEGAGVAAASQQRPLIIIAPDDSAWVVRAFLNHRDTVWAEENSGGGIQFGGAPILSAVFVGTNQRSFAGEVALDQYPPASAVAGGATGEQQPQQQADEPPMVPSVPCYSLNIAARSSGTDGGGAAVADAGHMACMQADDVEECVLGADDVAHGGGGGGGLPWLCSTAALRTWLPKVMGLPSLLH